MKTRGNRDPAAMRVQARVQDYALAITDASFVTVRDLRLFATTVYAGGEKHRVRDISNVRFDSLEFIHPSAGRRLLGDFEFSSPTTLRKKYPRDPANLSFYNCSLYGGEGHPLVNMGGRSLSM